MTRGILKYVLRFPELVLRRSVCAALRSVTAHISMATRTQQVFTFDCVGTKSSMPPKKNGKKSDDKSLKKENTASGKKNAEELPESDKKFFQAQIRDLEERLERYQHKCDELEVQAKDLHLKIDTVEKEKKDIALYLKRRVAKKEAEEAELAETLSKHQQAQEAERDNFELQLSLLRLELQENKDKFTYENMALAGKLASLEEFLMQKDKLMAERRALEEQIQKQKEEHQTEIYHLEKKAVLDNDRLKKEMLEHVAAVAAEFRRESDQKMPETTKRALQENLSVTAQLKHLSDKTKELLKENDALKVREKQLKIENETMEPLLQEITRKNVSNQKVVQQLTEKCKQMQTELERYSKLQTDHQQLLEDHSTVYSELHVLRQNHATLAAELQQTKADMQRQRIHLEEERRLGEQLKTVLQKAAVALKDALMEVPDNEKSEVHVIIRRNQMVEKLLAVLDTAAAVGEGPALVAFMPGMGCGQQPTKSPNFTKTGELPVRKSTNHLSHFKTGDLGLVPRKTHSTSSKTGHLSKCVYNNLHK